MMHGEGDPKTNPYLRRRKREGQGAHGVRSEQRTAKRLGAKSVAYSGAKPCSRGDMELGEFLIEAKSAKSGSIRLDLEWLLKIVQEARQQNRRPALALTFVTMDGRPRPNGRWVIIP